MFERNRVLGMLDRKQVPLGIQCATTDPALIELIGSTGFDFIMLDGENGGANPYSIEVLIRVSLLAGLAAYVRVSDPHNAAQIRLVLEAGAEGLFLPKVHTLGDIEAAALAAFFPPEGDRATSPATYAAGYNSRTFMEYAQWNNREISVVPIIENADGVAIVDSICAHPKIHMLLFEGRKFAMSLGEANKTVELTKTRHAFENVVASAEKHGVAVVGGPLLVPTAEACRRALKEGITVFCLGIDLMGFRGWCESTVSALSEAVSDSNNWSRPAVPASGLSAR